MKILGVTLGTLILATVVAAPILSEPCKISQSVYRDADGKGFELVFGEPILEKASSKATAQITHTQVGELYRFDINQSNGYGSIYLILLGYDGGLESPDLGIIFFDQDLKFATPLWFDAEAQAPKYAFIAGLGVHDYYRRKDDFYTNGISALVPPLEDMIWVYDRCQG